MLFFFFPIVKRNLFYLAPLFLVAGRGGRRRPSGPPGWQVWRQLKQPKQDPKRRRFDYHLRLRVDDHQHVGNLGPPKNTLPPLKICQVVNFLKLNFCLKEALE